MTDRYRSANIRRVINPVTTIIVCDNVHRIVVQQQRAIDASHDGQATSRMQQLLNLTVRRCTLPAWYVLQSWSDAAAWEYWKITSVGKFYLLVLCTHFTDVCALWNQRRPFTFASPKSAVTEACTSKSAVVIDGANLETYSHSKALHRQAASVFELQEWSQRITDKD